MNQPALPLTAAPERAHVLAGEAPAADVLVLELEHWEGPLDVLLELARRQKVDLRQISILALVDQYIAFINRAQALKLEVAADYLVMAAWLAYLKSAMLLPREEQEEPSPEDMALRLQLRLQRLAAMREAAARLMARDRLGRDCFTRGAPEGLAVDKMAMWQCSPFDLIAAYGQVKARSAVVVHKVAERQVVSLDSALARLASLLGLALDWTELHNFLPPAGRQNAQWRRSALASSFLAALELAKQGQVELAQEECFGPLRLRKAMA